jgi:hypothetical protein
MRKFNKLLHKQRNKFIPFKPVSEVDNEQVQSDWISGIQDQVDFANNPDVLPDYVLQLKVAKRKFEP